ncbi:MAG: glycine cleavage system aminomethyltransferase GcvT [Proteobacteria bacterium]|nr:glycine cleavage system aminomethyltransferase GcvT [Pseudomonadota bacterium]
MSGTLKKTPFHAFHTAKGAKMAPFAGYDMPIQYADGILKEHEWVRTRAGLFDVSHMGPSFLEGADAAANLARLTPSTFEKAAIGRAKYTVLTNPEGGIIDDLIVTKLAEDKFLLVLNAGRKDVDAAWIAKNISGKVTFTPPVEGTPLLALQGPYAAAALEKAVLQKQSMDDLPYMTGDWYSLFGKKCFITRTGYTGEDGFEIMLPAGDDELAIRVWDLLVNHPDVKAIGLGARDSLRLEMGYPLYGHDLDETTSPVEADIKWIISKKNDGFFGAPRVQKELNGGAARIRVGIQITDKGIAREGCTLHTRTGEEIGVLTSGGFSPTLKQAIGQGYIRPEYAKDGTEIRVDIRGKKVAAKVHGLSFVSPKTNSKPSA